MPGFFLTFPRLAREYKEPIYNGAVIVTPLVRPPGKDGP
jgi:hypothetical protein